MLAIAFVALLYFFDLTTVHEEEQQQQKQLEMPKTRMLLPLGRRKAS